MLNNPSNSDFSPSDSVLKKVNSMLTTGELEYLDSQTFADVMDYFNSKFKYEDSISIGGFGLKIHSNSGNIHLKKAQSYSSLNEIEKAREHLKIAEDLDKRNGDVFLTKGMLFSKEGYSNEAITSFRKAITFLEFPEDAYPYLAFELKAIGSFQEAISVLKKYLKIYPDDELCSNMLFSILEEHEYFTLGVKVYNSLLDIDPFNHLNWFYLGLFYKAKEELTEAYRAFEYCYLLDSGFIASYHELANILIEYKSFEKAITILEEVVAIEEPYAMTFTRLAELHRFEQNYSEALKYAKKASKEDPQLDSAWFELGLTLMELEDLEGAKIALNNAKGLNSDVFEYHFNHAQVFMKLQDWNEAKDLMIGIINKFGMDIGLLKSILICSIKTEDYDEALVYSTKAMEHSNDVDFLYFSAYFNYKHQNKEQTISFLIQAINQNAERLKAVEILMKDMFEESYISALVKN